MKQFVLSALLLGFVVSASADPLASLTTLPAEAHYGVAWGQSVTTPNGGPWNNIHFNFIDQDHNDFAIGGLYLLTQPYTGTPADLNSSVAGYLGFTDTIDNGIWEFSNVTLNPATQYFFYMDTVGGTAALLWPTGDHYTGGDAAGSGGPGTFALVSGADMLFVLTGDPVAAAPEPATLALMAGAAGLLAAFRRKRGQTPFSPSQN